MKNFRFLTFVLTVATLILSACGAIIATSTVAPAAATSVKVEAMPVSFVGIVDSIAGDQWVISGTTATVDASIVRDGPFNVGDQVKVEGQVNTDGSLTVSRVEAPGNTNDNGNANANDDNSNDGNTNDDNGGSNTNDDNSNDSNTNDDNGGSSTNDNNSNDGNTNDDNGGNTNDDNSNDGNTNDDNSGSGSGNDNGGGNDNDD